MIEDKLYKESEEPKMRVKLKEDTIRKRIIKNNFISAPIESKVPELSLATREKF